MPDILPILLLVLLGAPAAAIAPETEQQRAPAQGSATRTVTEVTIQQRVIIRIPRLPVARSAFAAAPVTPAAPLPPIRWVERKSDKCVPVENLAAATITGADSVDLILNGGKRLRARLSNDCPALDFYSGFYVRPSDDGKLCAARDSIRSRSGGECRITSFASLVPSR